jgi:UDP-N-acetylmuramate--alanine ligase
MFKKYQQIHFVGIGGIGMSGIAEVLINLGYRVTGSDVRTSDIIKRLRRLGAKIHIGHKRGNVGDAHVVVTSSAIKENNPEVNEAKKQSIAVVPRAEMLAELMRMKYGIAIAGTHGKTSTTSLIGRILDKAGLDPTIIIGGKVNSLKSNAKLGKGEFLVAEADESDRSFLKLSPTIGVITNIDPEHMENYKNFADMRNAFVEFANKVPFYGAVIACTSHPVVRRLLSRISRPVITYGGSGADYEAKNVTQSGDRLTFDAYYRREKMGSMDLQMTGSHHVLNALAAIAVARHIDIPFGTIRSALKKFTGAKRRFEILTKSGPIVVDDYAHHPVEVQATVVAARSGWTDHRVVVVIQPHRYSRLARHFDEFIAALKGADAIVVMDVYPAGERPHRTYTGEKLWKELCKKYPKKMSAFALSSKDVLTTLAPWCRKNDVILFLGAGSISQTAKEFAKSLT